MEVGMTVKIARDDATALDLRRQSGRVKDGRISRRLLAIALVLEGASRKVAAESCGMDRQTLRDWGEGRKEICPVDRYQP